MLQFLYLHSHYFCILVTLKRLTAFNTKDFVCTENIKKVSISTGLSSKKSYYIKRCSPLLTYINRKIRNFRSSNVHRIKMFLGYQQVLFK